MDKQIFNRFQAEIESRVGKLVSQYVYRCDVEVHLIDRYVLGVDVCFDNGELSDRELSMLENHLSKLLHDYDPYAELIEVDGTYKAKLFM